MPHRAIPFAALALALAAAGAPAVAEEPAPITAPATPAAENPDDKIKCRTTTVIGSLAKKARVCRTIAEWRKAAERGNDAAREITEHNRYGPSGN